MSARIDDDECVISEPSSGTIESINQSCCELHWDGIMCLPKEGNEFSKLKRRFYTSIGPLAQYCPLMSIHKNTHSTPIGQARFAAFQAFLKAMTFKRNDNPNLRGGWFGASRNEINQIIDDGFNAFGVRASNAACGIGLCLYSDCSVIESVLCAATDAEGFRHIVFCVVIVGNMEEVPPGSNQSCPSSEEFDSAVDNLENPTKYITWYPNVNTHVVPLYVISFKLDFHPKGFGTPHYGKPSSPWMPLNALISFLSGELPPITMCLIMRRYRDYRERKITRLQLVRHLRQLSGDKLIVNAVLAFRNQQRRI